MSDQEWKAWDYKREDITNSLPVPPRATQIEDHARTPCIARVEWSISGTEHMETVRVAWTNDAVCVDMLDPRSMVRGIWLPWGDVEPKRA